MRSGIGANNIITGNDNKEENEKENRCRQLEDEYDSG